MTNQFCKNEIKNFCFTFQKLLVYKFQKLESTKNGNVYPRVDQNIFSELNVCC
jgi:hypothetical protein